MHWGWKLALALGGVGGAALALGGSSSSSSGGSSGGGGGDDDEEPESDDPNFDLDEEGDEMEPMSVGVPFASGAPLPVWPIEASSKNKRLFKVSYRDVTGKYHVNMSRRFKASRGDRWHVGVDLYGDAGDLVLAPETGTLIETQDFLKSIPYDDAILIQGLHGVTVLLGEVKGKSWQEFGLHEGSVVEAGQPVARVGLTKKGSHMLHFETYVAGVTNNKRWYKGKPPPPEVLDPTVYLLRASALAKGGLVA